ncbi:MAG: hypothetical protein QW250_02725, partial [Sulfolobaceae archaeon]
MERRGKRRKYIISNYIIIGDIEEEKAKEIADFLSRVNIRAINYKVIVEEVNKVSLRISLAENVVLNLNRLSLSEIEKIYKNSEYIESKIPIEFHNIPAYKVIIEELNKLNFNENININIFKDFILIKFILVNNTIRLKLVKNLFENVISEIIDKLQKNLYLFNFQKNCNVFIKENFPDIILYLLLKCKYEIRNDEIIKRIYKIGYEIRNDEIIVKKLLN